MTTKRTTKTEKYLNFTKYFWNKLWKHHLKSLNNKKFIVWFNETFKRALNSEANIRKIYNIVTYEKTQTRIKRDKLKNTITIFFRNLIRKSKQPLVIYRYQLFKFSCLSIIGLITQYLAYDNKN